MGPRPALLGAEPPGALAPAVCAPCSDGGDLLNVPHAQDLRGAFNLLVAVWDVCFLVV